MNTPRAVNIFKWTPAGREPDGTGLCHGFASNPVQEGDGNGNTTWVTYPVAIIERADGKVELVDVPLIEFQAPHGDEVVARTASAWGGCRSPMAGV